MKTFHNPDIERVDFLDERYYTDKVKCEFTPGGIRFFPSVTFVLSQGMAMSYGLKEYYKNNDAAKIEDDLDKAGEQGSKVHNAIEAGLKGVDPVWISTGDGQASYTKKEWFMLLKFQEFLDQVKPDIISFEMKMADPKLECGGQMDLLMKIDGDVWLIDTKTSNYLWNSHYLQVTIYKKMMENHLDKCIKEVPVVAGGTPEDFDNEINRLSSMKPAKAGILHLNSAHRGPAKGKMQGKGWCLKEVPAKKHETQEEAYVRFYNWFTASKFQFDQEWAKYGPGGEKYYTPANMSVPDRIKFPTPEKKVQTNVL